MSKIQIVKIANSLEMFWICLLFNLSKGLQWRNLFVIFCLSFSNGCLWQEFMPKKATI